MIHLIENRNYKLKIGDLVKLRSGSPLMTVNLVGNKSVNVHYFVGDNCFLEKFTIQQLVVMPFDDDQKEWLNKNVLNK